MRALAGPLVLALAAAVAATTASASRSAPELQPQALAASSASDAFQLVLDGFRVSAGPRDLFSFGYRAEGSFNAPGRFCDAGHAVDLEYRLSVDWITGLRRLTCGDGTGELSVRTWLLGIDEASGSEYGIWKILSGTGNYETLRGIGAYSSVVMRGEPGDAVEARTLELWQGTAGFDREPPQLELTRVSYTKSPPTSCAYAVRIGFVARDGARAARVYYHVSAWNRFLLAAKDGTTVPGTAAVVLRIRPGAGGRMIRLAVEASDQVGNDRRVVRTLRLPPSGKGC
jgi:hypothetical protein